MPSATIHLKRTSKSNQMKDLAKWMVKWKCGLLFTFTLLFYFCRISKKCLKLPLGSSFFLYYLKGRKDKANFWEDLTQRLTSKLQDEEYESFCSFVNVYWEDRVEEIKRQRERQRKTKKDRKGNDPKNEPISWEFKYTTT